MAAQSNPPSPQTVHPEQALDYALAALRNGRPDIAEQIALALLARNPADPLGHYLRAQALMRAGQFGPARDAAALAHKAAQTPLQRWQTARLQAQIAANDNRHTAAEFWLRRASDLAPTAAQTAETRHAMRQVRARAPLSFTLSASLAPSSNVNGGASTQWSYIEGVEDQWVGQIRYEGRALPGWLGTADLGARYRLAKTQTTETRLTFKTSLRHALLSPAARTQWEEDNAFYLSVSRPDLVRPFRETMTALRFELGLNHTLQTTPNRAWVFDAKVSQSWGMTGQAVSGLTLEAQHHWVFGTSQRLSLGASAGVTSAGATTYVGHATFERPLGTLGTLTMAAHASQTQAGITTTGWGGTLGFAPARQIGLFDLSATFGLTGSHTPDVVELFTPVPGGRRTQGISLEISAAIPSVSFMGFAPELTLRHYETTSNVSRFGSRDTSIGLRLRSNF